MVEAKCRKNRQENRKPEDRLQMPVPAHSFPPHVILWLPGRELQQASQARAPPLHSQSLVDTSQLGAELQWERAELLRPV